MSEEIEVIDFTQNLKEEYKKLFDVFPADEIFPLNNIDFACKNNNYKVIKFFIGELLLGTAFLVLLKESKYLVINYVYVEKELRGKGYGHKIFYTLKSKFPEYKGIIVEVEPSNTSNVEDINNKRIKFYKELGFEIINYKYKILQTGKKTYQDMTLYMYSMNDFNDLKYKDIGNILDEYYKILFDTDYKTQYQLFD